MSTWRLGSGEPVVDLSNPSHVHASAADYVPEALAKIHAQGRSRLESEVDLSRSIGLTTCVETTASDAIRYAIRDGRRGHSRFALGREGEPCTTLFVVLEKDQEPNYRVLTAYVGRWSPKEPWDAPANEESWTFWEQHALIWGCERVDPTTETSECPWKRT